jgi:hypothetical protein
MSRIKLNNFKFGNMDFYCAIHNRNFQREFDLYQHMNSDAHNSFYCHVHNKIFRSQIALNMHISSPAHSENKEKNEIQELLVNKLISILPSLTQDQYGYNIDGYESDESSYIIDAMENLRLTTEGKRVYRKISLHQLNEELKKLHELRWISMKKMAFVLKSLGICLSNCVRYGNQKLLRAALKNNKKLLINRNEAKKFKYVKQCLIQIYQ